MFIRKLLLCTALLLLFSCSTLPDISRTYKDRTGPWLTLSGDASATVDINWLTNKSIRTELFWGENPEDLAPADCSTSPSRLHTVRLNNLKPDTRYYYSIEEEIYSFTTAPLDDRDYSITVVGDLQPFKTETMVNNRITTEAMVENGGDLIVQLGDVTENGGLNTFWALTLSNISQYASQRPFLAAAGNHDYYWRGEGNFRKLFPYDYPSQKELNHSQRYRNSALIFLDVHTEHPEPSESQLQWLEEELKAASEENLWTFVFFHETLMSTGTGFINMDLQSLLVPLLDKYAVHAVFFGHTHSYEHWLYPYGKSDLLYNEEDNPKERAIHYFLSGGGGASLRYKRLLEREERLEESSWFEKESGEEIILKAVTRIWNKDRFIEQADGVENYYHLPDEEPYSGYNSLFGFQYGEKTLHYINLEFSGENNDTCTISVHYPDGTLLSGPRGRYPQKWTIKKGETN